MKRWHLLGWTAFLVVVVLLGYRDTALARTESAGHALEAEVQGYRIALTSQNEWAQGDNTILVELTDSMGMPVNNAEVEVLITPGLDAHGESEESAHGPEAPAHTAADPGAAASHDSSVHNAPLNAPEAPAHGAMSSAPVAP